MAEGATPAERTTGGKEAPSMPGAREAAIARVSSYQSKNQAFGPGAFKSRPTADTRQSPFAKSWAREHGAQYGHGQNYPKAAKGTRPGGGVYRGGARRTGGTYNESNRNYKMQGGRRSGYDPTGQRRYTQA